MQIKRGQTWRNRAGTHVHVVSVNNGRAMLTLNEYDPLGIIYTVDASGNALFNDRNGDLVARVNRVYIAGPMTGVPEWNFPLFNSTARRLRDVGAHVENPAEINPDTDMEWHEAMRANIPRLLTCDTLYLLPGWEKSRGATLEYSLATALGMTIRYP